MLGAGDRARACASALSRVGVSPALGALDGADAAVVTGALEGAVADGLRALAASGAPVLGTGDGFGVLCELGLLDGRIEPDVARAEADCIVEGRPTPFTQAIPAGRQLRLEAACAARYAHPDPAQVESEARVVLRYCTADGEVLDHGIAGVCNAAGNVLGVLTACDPQLYRSALAWRRGTPARVR